MAGPTQRVSSPLPEKLQHSPAFSVLAQMADQGHRDTLLILGTRQDTRSVGVERRQKPEPAAAQLHRRAADDLVTISNQKQALLLTGPVIVDIRRVADQER